MSTKRISPAGIALSVIVACYVGGALILRFGSSERTLGIMAGFTCALLGLTFLALSLPLGKLLNRARKEVPFMPGPVPWPRSSPGWSVLLLLAAIVLFVIAAVAFYWGDNSGGQACVHPMVGRYV